MRSARSKSRPLRSAWLRRAALLCALSPLAQACFVYTEELLDSDVVSLGGGEATSMPAQQKLKAAARSPAAGAPAKDLDLQALELFYLAADGDAGLADSP